MRRAKQEPKLDEVKFVLKKLQRLDASPGEAAGQALPPGALIKMDASRLGRKPATNENSAKPGRRVALYLSAAGAIAVLSILYFALEIGTVPNNPQIVANKNALAGLNQEIAADSTLLTEARQALSEGDALRARNALLRAGPELHPAVAFMLAQSYDPNYLQSLTKTNALPDKAAAKRWYEKWYELAVQSGLEMDSGRLHRIINAMH